jgi:type II secretory ATPase GspE/PulE/Tfp pilus assembly ATPase PilB-like protein
VDHDNQAFLRNIRGLLDLSQDEVESVLQKRGKADLEFVRMLIEAKVLGKERACRLWGDTIEISYVDPLASIVTQEAVDEIPREIAEKGSLIGLYILEGVLTVAMAHPRDQQLISRLEAITQRKVSPVFALPVEIQDAIAIHYSSAKEFEQSMENFEKTQRKLLENLSTDDLESLGKNSSVANMVNALLFFAISERASDIHIEPLDEIGRVRMRVDGKLREYFDVSLPLMRAMTARLKVICRLNPTEMRFPQDGRCDIPLGVGKADFRINFLPTVRGQKVVIRILAGAGQKTVMSLDKMMLSQTILQPMRRLLGSPNGIFFVTGPTGSGKTTTLYAALQELNDGKSNISTIEDPVEISVEGVNQSQVNAHIDLSFSLILRALLRQDPDIILLGEIRDKETAKIAIEAALTGHLVLSTLHTNSAIQAITRLIEIGVEPYMVAPSVLGVLAQRLAARICDKCKEPYFPSEAVLRRYFRDIPEEKEIPFYHGKGCEGCRGSGYRGRVAFHELLLVSNKIRSLISQNAGQRELTVAATELGFRSLRYDGLKKVLLGLTTPEEVDRHSGLEWSE